MEIISIIFSPEVFGPLCALIGSLLIRYCPSWIPIAGTLKKTIEELVYLHNVSSEKNDKIIEKSAKLKNKLTKEVLAKGLD